jgi:hypothetical protein
LANTWSEFTAPANIYSLALSGTHVWFTDKSENLYYCALGGQKGILWRKVCSKVIVKVKPKSESQIYSSKCTCKNSATWNFFFIVKATERNPLTLFIHQLWKNVYHMS